MKVIVETLTCKYCGSEKVVKFGMFQNSQRWWCNDCKRKFADNDALPRMKTPIEQVATALSMYYEGMSLAKIRRHLDQMHNNNPSDSTIYAWIKKFSKQAVDETDTDIPDVGDTWVADETVLKIGGQKAWLFDILDAKSRYLLATHLSLSRRIPDVEMVMRKAIRRTGGQIPRFILTDRMNAYPEGIEFAFENRVKHIQVAGITAEINNNLVERFHGTLKSRTKIMRV